MMWAIPLTMLVLIVGLLLAQKNQHMFIERQKSLDKTILGSEEVALIRKELNEYKKKVDTLILKAGFKQ